MRRGLVVLSLLYGCNQAFDLTPTALVVDAQVDDDRDGVDNAFDNCPNTANASQSDLDHDTIGDVCDNCPLIANAAQENVGDGDQLGDICDPHPSTDGDCLLLLDTFSDPTQFDAEWMVTGTATVTPAAGHLDLVAPSTGLLVTSRELANDQFDVHLVGDARLPVNTGAQVMALSNSNRLANGEGCAVGMVGTEEQVQVFYDGTSGRALSSEAIGASLSLRLVTRLEDGSPYVTCRADHGIAFGFMAWVPTAAPTTGSPGIQVVDLAVTVRAIAISRFQPATPCPEAIVR